MRFLPVQKQKEEHLHESVLLKEVIQYLNPQPNQHFIDATVGGGGHAEKILELTSPNGTLLGFDLDSEALKIANKRLKNFKNRFSLIQQNFTQIPKYINEQSSLSQFNGILFDLGISSFQLRSKNRGFSFQTAGPLDMRFGKEFSGLTAADILNHWSQKDLQEVLENYGEERYSREIAKLVVLKRKKEKFQNTDELVKIINSIYRHKPKLKKINPATKTFQALRIAVNDELNNLRTILSQSLELLLPQGRLVVISFHSLEDRIVKNFFREESRDCLCPPEFPVCRCGHKAQIRILTKKVIKPSWEEIKQNYRARSAKLRAAETLN